MLFITRPWPGMLKGVWNDPIRYKEQYWSYNPDYYLTGDNARQDQNGYYWIMGRIDDVINVAGHRLSTIEIESALVAHPWVAEAAVVGKHDDIKGQAICAFVTLKSTPDSTTIHQELQNHVRKCIGSLAVPDAIQITTQLPKTRSGKIMRRLLRDIADSKQSTHQDLSTLEDLSTLSKLAEIK